jgi:hypothetical protein
MITQLREIIMIRRISSFTFLALIASINLCAQDTQSEATAFGENGVCIMIGIGAFSPATGTGGITINGGFYREFIPRLVLGGELSYKEFKSTLFFWDNVDFSTFTATAVLKYCIPGKSLQLFYGCYLECGIHSVDRNDMPGVFLQQSVAGSYGLGVLAGTNVRVNERLMFLLEGRYGGDWMNTELQGIGSETKNLGGLNVLAGIMFLF